MRKAAKKKGRRAALAAIVICLLTGLLCASLNLYAGVVHVRYVNAYIADLPQSFEGMTALFVSDFHLQGMNTPERAGALMRELENLKPDMLILGGDYADASALLGGDDSLAERAAKFFEYVKAFNAPCGKFAVLGERDYDAPGIDSIISEGGVTLLKNSGVRIYKDGASIVVAGLEDWKRGTRSIRGVRDNVSGSDCVILVTHNPDAFTAISAGGERWADVVLAGHLLGGQINAFGYGMTNDSDYGERYIAGQISENGHSMLVSRGVGCKLVNLRLGAPAEAHLITFRRAS